ncbi:hypothetical protein EW146_g3469 [Bondarzewia mesenterica]|uniref:Uncharacterized protein n=1 Tax=Bondarzewia mesenterica TaxID=1095465 RepID=A0A4S4LXQ8_9AGAM|nr:hypothetical protein EW146_g3469 [Bondarzewia mesenterica]
MPKKPNSQPAEQRYDFEFKLALASDVGHDPVINVMRREFPWYGLWDLVLNHYFRETILMVYPQYPVWRLPDKRVPRLKHDWASDNVAEDSEDDDSEPAASRLPSSKQRNRNADVRATKVDDDARGRRLITKTRKPPIDESDSGESTDPLYHGPSRRTQRAVPKEVPSHLPARGKNKARTSRSPPRRLIRKDDSNDRHTADKDDSDSSTKSVDTIHALESFRRRPALSPSSAALTATDVPSPEPSPAPKINGGMDTAWKDTSRVPDFCLLRIHRFSPATSQDSEIEENSTGAKGGATKRSTTKAKGKTTKGTTKAESGTTKVTRSTTKAKKTTTKAMGGNTKSKSGTTKSKSAGRVKNTVKSRQRTTVASRIASLRTIQSIEILFLLEVKKYHKEKNHAHLLRQLQSAQADLRIQGAYQFSRGQGTPIIAVAAAGDFYSYTTMEKNSLKPPSTLSEIYDPSWVPPQDVIKPLHEFNWSIEKVISCDEASDDWEDFVELLTKDR